MCCFNCIHLTTLVFSNGQFQRRIAYRKASRSSSAFEMNVFFERWHSFISREILPEWKRQVTFILVKIHYVKLCYFSFSFIKQKKRIDKNKKICLACSFWGLKFFLTKKIRWIFFSFVLSKSKLKCCVIIYRSNKFRSSMTRFYLHRQIKQFWSSAINLLGK